MEIREQKLKKLVKRIQKVPDNNISKYTKLLNLKIKKRSDIILTNCSNFLKSTCGGYDENALIEEFDKNKPHIEESSKYFF